MDLVEESGIDESDKNNVASRGKMLLHVVKSLEYWSFTVFSLYRYSALGLFKIFMFSVQSHLEHILPELGWSCHVAGGHSTNIISSKRSSFPGNICKAIEQRIVELVDFILPMRL